MYVLRFAITAINDVGKREQFVHSTMDMVLSLISLFRLLEKSTFSEASES